MGLQEYNDLKIRYRELTGEAAPQVKLRELKKLVRDAGAGGVVSDRERRARRKRSGTQMDISSLLNRRL